MTRADSSGSRPVVVITGSDGLIGSALIRDLHNDFTVVGFDNDPTSHLDDFHDLIFCDLTKCESVAEAFHKLRQRHGDRIASFIHLAAYYDFAGEDSPLYEELTVKGTGRVLRVLESFDVEQFVFSSTMLVMKPSEDGKRITESSPLQADWQYPESKLRTEELIEKEHGNIPSVILRIAGVYDEWGRAVPIAQQMKRIHEKELESYFFPGDPDHGQSMVHLDDVVSCIRKVIEKRGELRGVEKFLVGETDVMSYGELQDVIGDLVHGKEWPAIRIPKSVAKLGAKLKQELPKNEDFIQPWMIDLADEDYRIDISKAQSQLSWTPRHSLRETLPIIARRLVEDTSRWYEENGLREPELADA